MPRLGNQADMENFKLNTSHYGFSAQRIGELQATEYTLVTIIFDQSSSTTPFRADMKKALEQVVESCDKSPRKDNLLVRVGVFASGFSEVHGFRLLSTIQPGEYDALLNGGGMTALNDACINGVEAMESYGKSLTESDFSVNAIGFIITDGAENVSKHNVSAVKKALQSSVTSEALESVITVLIGVNLDNQTEQLLNQFQTDAGITQFVSIGDATPSKLAKLADFVSKSISATSQSLGSGTSASQQIKQNSNVVF